MRLGDPADIEEQLKALLDEASPSPTVRLRCAPAWCSRCSRWTGELVAGGEAPGEGARRRDLCSRRSLRDLFVPRPRVRVVPAGPQDAVELYERCIEAVEDAEGDPALEARYATLLSYALSDMGEIGRAEEVVGARARAARRHAGPVHAGTPLLVDGAPRAYGGSRLVALNNVRKAIALLQATDDTLHLARAHILAGGITLSRGDADGAESHLDRAESLLSTPPSALDLVEITIQRARIAALRGEGSTTVKLARRALELSAGANPVDDGRALHVLGDGLALMGEHTEADRSFRKAVDILEQNRQWRDATTACRSWAKMLRELGREEQALDVLERATDLGTRALPAEAHAER